MLPHGTILATLVILSGAISLWSGKLARAAVPVEPNEAIIAAFFVSYATLLLTTIGLALSTIQNWLDERSNSVERSVTAARVLAVLASLFGVLCLIIEFPIASVDVTVDLPDSKVLPPTRH